MKIRIFIGLILAIVGLILILYSIMLLFGDVGIFPIMQRYITADLQNLLSVAGILCAIGMIDLMFSVCLFGWL